MSARPSDTFRARLELAEEGHKNACAAAEAAREAALARADAELEAARRAILLEALAALDGVVPESGPAEKSGASTPTPKRVAKDAAPTAAAPTPTPTAAPAPASDPTPDDDGII